MYILYVIHLEILDSDRHSNILFIDLLMSLLWRLHCLLKIMLALGMSAMLLSSFSCNFTGSFYIYRKISMYTYIYQIHPGMLIMTVKHL